MKPVFQYLRRHWRISLVVLILGIVAFDYFERRKGANELEEVLAQLDREFPGDWRLEDLEAKKPPATPKEDDPFEILIQLGREQPNWFKDSPLEELRIAAASDPRTQLTVEQIESVRQFKKKAEPFADRLRRFENTRIVNHPLIYPANTLETLLEHDQAVRQFPQMNKLRILVALQDGDEKELVSALIATQNALPWLNYDHFFVSQLVRIAVLTSQFESLELVLARRELSIDSLRRLAALIDEEQKSDPFVIGIRGELGSMNRLLENIAKDFAVLGAQSEERSALAEWFFYRYFMKSNHANFIRELAALRRDAESRKSTVEFESKMDVMITRLRRLKSEQDKDNMLFCLLMPAFNKVYSACQRYESALRLMRAALAMEIFRLENKRWPKDFQELVPKYLPAVPIDPWTDEPTKWKQRPDGITIYNVGPDKIDNGGVIDRIKIVRDGADHGFELFNPDQRVPQPAKVVPKEDVP